MRVIITAVGPDHWGLADRIVQYVTSVGAIIAEIQMDDHAAEDIFSFMLRCHWPGRRDTLAELRARMEEIEFNSGLSIRIWARPEEGRPPRLVLCTTYRPETARAVLKAIHAGRLRANPVALVGNRPACRSLAEQFGVEWHMIGDDLRHARQTTAWCRSLTSARPIISSWPATCASCRLQFAGNSPAVGSSTCTTACCLHSRVPSLTATPLPAICSPTDRRSTLSCRNWTPVSRSSTRTPSPSRRGRPWTKSLAPASETMSRAAWWRACIGSCMVRSSCISARSSGGERSVGVSMRTLTRPLPRLTLTRQSRPYACESR